MLLIQLKPLIQFNVYYILHIKNNNRNNFLLIGFMLLIQLKLIINLILLLIDFILLIQLMPARKGRGSRPKWPRTEA